MEHEVTVGPKSLRSKLPMGKVPTQVAEQIALAEEGKLPRQLYNFNLRVSPRKKTGNGIYEALYHRSYVLNGACRFKVYGLLDVILYKLSRLFVKKS